MSSGTLLVMADCPNCGCNLSRVVETHAPWFRVHETDPDTIETRECDHCRTQWENAIVSEPPPEALAKESRYCVVFKALRCPFCESRKHHVTNTLPAVGGLLTRYHRCDNPTCGERFKSVER